MKSRIRNLGLAITLTALTSVASSTLGQVVIEGTELPMCQQVTNQLAGSHFIRFSSLAGWVSFADDGGRTGIYGTDPVNGYPPCAFIQFHAPHSCKFVDPGNVNLPGVVDGTINITWGDGGGDTDFLTIDFYDINGTLLGSVNSQGTTWQNVSFTGNGIHKIEFRPSNGAPTTSDTFVDRLEYPLPHGLGPTLTLTGPCPGPMTADVTGGTPAGIIALLIGNVQGQTTIPPGNPCAATTLGIQGGVQVVATRAANANGNARFNGNARVIVCGRFMQALDVASCGTSNVERIQ